MSHWEQLVRIGIIGTDKGNLPEELVLWMKKQGIDTKQNRSSMLLDAIAMQASIKKAARLPTVHQGMVAERAEPETASLCSNESVQHLNLILADKYEAALPEFLHLLSKNNKILPPESLPELLGRCMKHPHLWVHIGKRIGKRGAWLLRQHPEWNQLTDETDLDAWEVGDKASRIKILESLCRTNPTQVVPLLTKTWAQDTVHHKKAFLNILAKYPDEAYEPFLEELLDDKRKEIRLLAANILGEIPSSRLVERMFQRLVRLIELKSKTFGKSKFKIELPEAIDDALLRDGLNIKTQGLQAGLLAARLSFMLSIVPPQRWEEHFKLKREQLLEIAIRSEWSEVLIQGWILAAAKYQNEAWMSLLLEFWMEHYEKAGWTKLDIQAIFMGLSDGIFNKIAIKYLAQKNGFIEESEPLMQLLKSGNHLWEDKLMLLFISNIKTWLSAQGSRYWSGWHYKGILNKVAYTCNPNLYDILWRDWSQSQTLWQGWEKQMTELFDVLKFRKEMLESLKD